MSVPIDVLSGAVASGTSVLFASFGELVSERAGVINLGTEGSMLMGAFTGVAVTVWSGSPWLGAAMGGVGGGLLALIHAWLVVVRKANQLASGLTVMFFGIGLTSLLGKSFAGTNVAGFQPVNIPFLSALPVFGKLVFSYEPLVYASVLLMLGMTVFLFRTRAGLVLRSVGEDVQVVYAAGSNPQVYRILAVTVGGVLAGIGGSELSLGYTHSWVEDMTQGRGIIAVALVIFASWVPWRALIGAYLFGGAQVLQMTLQGLGVQISPYLLFMAPYVLTLAVLFLVSRRRVSTIPNELSHVFGDGGGG